MTRLISGWNHACRTPGNFAIWLRRIQRPGRTWICPTCGNEWSLHRRNPTGNYAFWEWRP